MVAGAERLLSRVPLSDMVKLDYIFIAGWSL